MFGCGTAGAGSKPPAGITSSNLGTVVAIVVEPVFTKWSVPGILPGRPRRQTWPAARRASVGAAAAEDDRLDGLGDPLRGGLAAEDARRAAFGDPPRVDLAARPVPLDGRVRHPEDEPGHEPRVQVGPDAALALRLGQKRGQ